MTETDRNSPALNQSSREIKGQSGNLESQAHKGEIKNKKKTIIQNLNLNDIIFPSNLLINDNKNGIIIFYC